MPKMNWSDIQMQPVAIPEPPSIPSVSMPNTTKIIQGDIKDLDNQRMEEFKTHLDNLYTLNTKNGALLKNYVDNMTGLAQDSNAKYSDLFGSLLEAFRQVAQQNNTSPTVVPTSASTPIDTSHSFVSSPRDAAYNFGFMMKNGKYYSYNDPKAGAKALLNQLQNFITGKSQSAKEYDMVRGFPVGKYRHRGATWYVVPEGATSYKPFANGQNPNTIGHIWGSGLYAPRLHGGNNPDEYVANLVKWSGIGRDEILDPNNSDQMTRLLMAVARMEGNRWRSHLTPELIKSLF